MAYTYIGTPNQRIQQAQQRISNDGSVAINPTLSAYMQAAQQEQAGEQAVEQQSKANFGVRLGDTLGDVAKNTLDGMLKAGEGLLDFGAGAVGMFAGWFGNEDLKQRASDWAARDLVGEMWESGRQRGLDVDFEDSYINEMSETGQNIVRGVAQGVGQMLPMVAVTLATGGAGGAAAAAGKISATAAKGLAKAGQVANLVGLGMSAAGTSTERALNTDIVDANGNTVRPSLDRAFLYGLASGAVEMATEKLVGGVFEKFTGTGLADKVINKLSKSVKFGKAVQFGLNVVGEGVEEMVSEAVGKTLETIYNSPDGKMHWESPDMQDVIVSGIVGSLTAAVMGGADVGVRKISNVATAQDAMLDYENTQKKADNLARQGKLTAEDVAKFDADNAKTLDTISRRYQRASENGRAKMKASIPGIMELLNEDGTVKKIALVDGATEITADSAVQAMSGSLAVSRRTEVANALKEQNLTLAQNLDNSQKTNMSKLEQVLKLVGKKTGQTTKVVVAEHMPLDNAHTDGDIMYISKDRLSNVETMAQDVAHEAFHFAEGTDEYRKMVDFFGTIRLNGESLVDTAIDKVRKLGYDVDDGVFDAIKNGENVSSKNTSQVRLAFSEINAKMAELLLGDAETINKLIERDRSLARKVLSNIRDYAKIIEMTFKGDAEGIETLKQMRKAIKLYEDALAASGEDYLRGKSIEHQRAIQESKYAQRNPKSVTEKEYNHHYWATGNNVISQNELGTLDEAVGKINSGEYYPRTSGGEYMIAVGENGIKNKIVFTDGHRNSYTISKIIEISLDNETDLSIERSIIYESEAVGVSTEDTQLFKIHTRTDVPFADFRGKLAQDIRNSDVKQDRRRGGSADENGTDSGIKHSLRESIEDDVIKKYGKTYRWAETGYLLKDGSRIDMSGRNEGAPGGYRTVDHRDIFYDIDGSYGTDAMVEFMQRGNIRVMPEQPGINLQIEPTEAQYRQIQNLIETLGWKNKEFSVDFDNANGDTIDNLYYEGNVSARKVISDIQYYFKEGKKPYQSELSKFRYSLRENATDSEGRKLSKKQLEFFKDSKVVDENGNLLVVYHGTKSDFTIFDKSKGGESNSIADIGFWFTTSKQGAEQWAENAWWGDNEQGKAMAAYLKIDNPKIYETTDNNSKDVVLKERDLRQKRSKIASKYLYDINRNNSITGVAEWDAFRMIVENYDKESQSFYLDKLSLDKRENVTHDAEEYKAIYAEEEKIGKEISRLHFTRDGYEKFRADLYSLTGQSAEDANFNGNGFALKNAQETKELFVKQLKEQGYDGLIIHTNFDANSFGLHNTQYVVFDANQIKSIDNLNPTENPDIRYSLREKPIFNDKKTKAELIKRIEGMQLDFYGKYFAANTDVSKFFAEDAQSDRLASQIVLMANDSNESNRYAYAEDLAESIINNMVVTDVDPQLLSEKTGLANAVRQYMHKLNLTEDVMKEVKYHYGEKEARVIRMLWGAPNDASTKMSIDDAVGELQNAGYVFGSDNVSDQFIEMLDIVEQSRKDAHRELSKTAKQLLSTEEYAALKEEIRDDVLSFMEEKGTQEQWAKYYNGVEREAARLIADAKQKAADIEKQSALEEQLKAEKQQNEYSKKIKALEQELQEVTARIELRAADDIEYNAQRHKLIDRLWGGATSLSRDNLQKYKNASDLMNKDFAKSVSKLSGVRYRGDIKKAGARKLLAGVKTWYNINNPLLTGGMDAISIEQAMKDSNVEKIGYLDKTMLEAIDFIESNIDSKKPLSNDELRAALVIIDGARHVLKEYNSVQIGKKNLVLSDTAKKANSQAKEIAPHIKKSVAKDKMSGLMRQIDKPADVIAEMTGYRKDSPLSLAFEAVQDGELKAARAKMSLAEKMETFFRQNKKYKKSLTQNVTFGKHTIRRDIALSLYMLAQQPDSINGLTNGGWGYRNKRGYWVDCGKLTQSDINALTELFSKGADAEFLKVVRSFFNEAGKLLVETDMQYKGYSLIELSDDSTYFPIERYKGDMAKSSVDNEDTQNAMRVSVANYSFTKERVKNERRITVSPIMDVVIKHAREVGNYTGLAVPIKEMLRIYHCNVGENGVTDSLRNTINEQSWNKFDSYLMTLLSDIQGIKGKTSTVDRALESLRRNYATFQLGFNLKTPLVQFGGYPAAFAVLSAKSMVQGMGHSIAPNGKNAQNMLKYNDWAAVKAYEKGTVLVDTLSDKVSSFADVTTKPIQWADNALNRMIWNACQCEVETQTGYKFGTEENMKLAAELHKKVGRETQGNSARSEVSAMQRSNNVLVKGLAMFNSDGFKLVSLMRRIVGELRAYNYLNKKNPGTISQTEIKNTRTALAKASTAIIVSNLVVVLMGQLMKYVLNKDREDKDGNEISFWQDFGMDYLAQTVGMVPIARDLYNLFVEGYDMNNYAIEMVTDLATSSKDLLESITAIAKGEVYDSTDIAKPLKSLIYAVGQITGLPTRNVYNYVYGLTKRFSPSAAYEWNSLFYNNGYTKDLKKAIEKDDVDLQKTIIGLMLKDNGMTDTSEQVNNRLRELYAQGYTVLPRTVKDTLNYNGETYSLSKKQQTAFKATYGQANKEVEELIESRSFSSLSAEIQARAIKWIYDYYYENAVYETVGEDADSKNQLFGEVMDISRFAMTIAACKSVESKVDKKGNVVAGSKKQAILQLLRKLNLSSNEILMILAYLGYSIEGNEQVIKNFISRIGLTRSQQKSLLQYCGIAA